MKEIAVQVDDDRDSSGSTAYETALAHCEESRRIYEREQALVPHRTKSSPELIRLLNHQFASQPYTTKFIYQHQLNIWVYRCVFVVVGQAKRPEPRLFREWISKGVLKSEQLPYDHPAVSLLHNPNSYDTWPDLAEKYWTSRDLTGGFYLAYDDKTNTLDHLRSDRVEILPDARKMIGGYRYSVVGQTMDFAAEDVIYGRYWNPDDDYYGLPPLKAASNSIAAHMKASGWNLNFFDNSAMLLGYLKSTYDFSNDKELLESIRSEWGELYQGYSKFGKFAVLGGDLDWKPLSPTHSEMGFTELLNTSKAEIFSAFGVPNIYGNDKEGQNYANSREHQALLWQAKMIPNLKSDEATFGKFLNKRFAEKGERIVLKFDLTGIEALREGVVAEAEASRILVSSFQRSPNQARARRGEAPEPGGDVCIGPMSFVRLDQVGEVLAAKTPATSTVSTLGANFKSIISDPKNRRGHWELMKGIIESNEAKMKRLLAAIFSDWREYMLARLSPGAETVPSPEDVLFDAEGAKPILARGSELIFRTTMEQGGKRALATIASTGKSLRTKGNFDLHDPRVDSLLRARIQRFAEYLPDATYERLKESLQEGIAAGENSRDLARRVEEGMDREVSNASTIARTEILPCYHEGQVEGMRQSGVVEGKEWLSAFTPTSREDHVTASLQVVGLDEPFSVGGELLMYPGDPSGSASNIINCLCDVLPVVVGTEE